jgi:hypothetical protein
MEGNPFAFVIFPVDDLPVHVVHDQVSFSYQNNNVFFAIDLMTLISQLFSLVTSENHDLPVDIIN